MTTNEDPDHLRELDERAIADYGARLVGAPEAARDELEATYMRHLERCCESLIQRDPTALAAVASAAPFDYLRAPRHRYLLLYYRGMGAGLREQFLDARREFEVALAAPDLDEPIRARILNSGAVFARMEGDYERARAGYRESLAIWQRLGNTARQGLALMNLGILSYYLQDYPAAQRDLEASLEVFRVGGSKHWLAMAHSNLGLVARDQGRWDDALGAFAEATTIFERDGPLTSLGHVTNNVGEVELLRGHFEVATGYFERALTQMTTRVYTVDVYVNLGLVHEAQGEDATALDQYATALKLALELGRREIVALVHYRVGQTEARRGNLEVAGASYAAAITVIEDARAPIRDEGLMISLMGRWQQVYEAAVHLCRAAGDPEGAFAYAERARARAFADTLARHGSGLEQANVVPVTAREVRAALPAGTVLLVYFATGLHGPESNLLKAIPRAAATLRTALAAPPRLLLFALTRDALRVHDCTLDPNVFGALSPFLRDGRRFLQEPVLRRAWKALIGPIVDLLDQAERVVIVPHGPLHQLSFAALLDDAGEPLLLRAPDLAYVPSATLLRIFGERAEHAGTPRSACLALGYDGGTADLRHTQPEAEAVARISGGVAWQGAAGMGERLRQVAGEYRWLHFACHGEFDHDDPLRSWLEIGPDERLDAATIMEHWRLRADLVTLSACRSGVSQVLRGDEPMGLVRALLYAGARAVLVTLWQVEDTSARLLMEHFYTSLLQQGTRADPAAALRDAQHYLREQVPYAEPEFWAAYVVVGGMAPVSIST